MKIEPIKVLLIEHSLPFYHIHSWQLLGSHPLVDLTIAYGQGYFTGKRAGVPEGIIPEVPSFRYSKCNIVRNLFGFSFLWHNASIALVKNNRYDLIIHQAELKMISLFYIFLLARLKGIKFALWGIGNPLEPNKLTDKYRKFLAKKADAFIFYSELNKKRYINWGIESKKLFVAKNSVDVRGLIDFSNNFSEMDKHKFKEKNNINSFTILTVGRLIDRKKIDWLIRACDILINKKNYDIKLVIIGDGEKRNDLKRFVIELGLVNNVLFLGKLVGLESLGPWYCSTDIIVAPSQIGHLSTEAHAFKKPLIISDCKNCMGPEHEILVPDVTGLIYRHGEISHLVEKIEKLYLSIELLKKLSENSQKRAIDFAGTNIMVNGFLSAISCLCDINLKKF